MAHYRTTKIVFLPALYEAGAEVEFNGWPMHGLEPIDDDAKQIVEYWRVYNGYSRTPNFQVSPYVNGKLVLPPLGLPAWQLGKKFCEIENRASDKDHAFVKAKGHYVMGSYRPSYSSFNANAWPTDDVVPLNAQAKIIAQYKADHPSGPFAEIPWNEDQHCLNVPHKEAA